MPLGESRMASDAWVVARASAARYRSAVIPSDVRWRLHRSVAVATATAFERQVANRIDQEDSMARVEMLVPVFALVVSMMRMRMRMRKMTRKSRQ